MNREPARPVPATQYLTSRWAPSAITFGPAGRIVATVLVLAPIVFAVFVNVMFLVSAVLWLFIVPRALRDIWQRTRVGSRDVPTEDPGLHLSQPPPVPAIHERQAPTRW